MSITSLSAEQLRHAADLKEQIEGLEDQLNSILGGEVSAPVSIEATVVAETLKAPRNGRKKFSAETRAKMAAAQKARWAAKKGLKEETRPAIRTVELSVTSNRKRAREARLILLARAREAGSPRVKISKLVYLTK